MVLCVLLKCFFALAGLGNIVIGLSTIKMAAMHDVKSTAPNGMLVTPGTFSRAKTSAAIIDAKKISHYEVLEFSGSVGVKKKFTGSAATKKATMVKKAAETEMNIKKTDKTSTSVSAQTNESQQQNNMTGSVARRSMSSKPVITPPLISALAARVEVLQHANEKLATRERVIQVAEKQLAVKLKAKREKEVLVAAAYSEITAKLDAMNLVRGEFDDGLYPTL